MQPQVNSEKEQIMKKIKKQNQNTQYELKWAQVINIYNMKSYLSSWKPINSSINKLINSVKLKFATSNV